MTKVMRKEARHTQRWDRASGVPLDAQVVSGPTSSCVWNPRVFADDARGWQCPFVLCLPPQGCANEEPRVPSLLQKELRATEQLNLHSTTTEPTRRSY